MLPRSNVASRRGRRNEKRLQERNSLIDRYQSYAEGLVHKLVHALNLPLEFMDEYIAAGNLGLVEAADRYDPQGGAPFSSYAYLRIRGAVIDSIRANCNLKGRMYARLRALEAANNLAETRYEKGRSSLARMLEYTANVALAYRLSMSEVQAEINSVQDDRDNQEARYIQREEARLITCFVDSLPKRERDVVKDFYFRGRSFTEISRKRKGLSKSWISRLHARALTRMRALYEQRRTEGE